MHSIKLFFTPLKELHKNDESKSTSSRDCQKNQPLLKKEKRKPRQKLLTIVNHEVEDITNLICQTNVDTDSKSFDEGNQNASSTKLQQSELLKELEGAKDGSNKFIVNNASGEYLTRSPGNQNASNSCGNVLCSPVKSDVQSRRFSFNITSPEREASLQTAVEKKAADPSDALFDEAFNIVPNEFSNHEKESIELSHPNKRFKAAPSFSEPEIEVSRNLSPVLVPKKLTIPCLQPSSAFANPPKDKEFYILRHSLSKSRQKNYVIMTRASVKKKCSFQGIYFEIEKILTHKTTIVQGGHEFRFLVKWSGFSDKYTSWEPEDHFNCSPHFLLNYVETLLRSVGNSDIKEQLKATKTRMRKLTQKISIVSSQAHAWQLNAELSSQSFKWQYRRLLKQYSNKVLEELGPSFPSVKIENTVDFDLPPLNFTFVRDRFAGKGVHISDDTLIGCICSGDIGVRDCCLSPDVECCPHLGGAAPPYNNKGRLVLKPGLPIYECNARCSCGPDCGNRIVQRGSQVKTAIYKTSDKGWGLKTLQNIPKGTFVVEYVGEVITFDEAEKRGMEYDAQGLTYLFDLDYQSYDADGMFTIDAAFYGNTSHFINHSCDPNLIVFSCWISNLDLRLPHICLFAVKPIKFKLSLHLWYDDTNNSHRRKAGEELTFNYRIDKVPEGENDQRLSVECKCGTAKCVKYLHG